MKYNIGEIYLETKEKPKWIEIINEIFSKDEHQKKINEIIHDRENDEKYLQKLRWMEIENARRIEELKNEMVGKTLNDISRYVFNNRNYIIRCFELAEGWSKKYKISIDEGWKLVIQRQKLTHCQCCKKQIMTKHPKWDEPYEFGSNPSKFELDHCHRTNKIRGFVCKPCNSMLGRIENNKNVEKAKKHHYDWIQNEGI